MPETTAHLGPTTDAAPSPDVYADPAFESLDPRYIPAERIAWAILDAIIGISSLTALLVLIAAPAPRWVVAILAGVGLVVMLVLVQLTVWLPAKAHAMTRYRLSAVGLEIHRGIVFRSVTIVPRSRVQHTDVVQGPIARRFGLAKLVTHTAGSERAVVELAGLERGRAMEMRDRLIVLEGRDSV